MNALSSPSRVPKAAAPPAASATPGPSPGFQSPANALQSRPPETAVGGEDELSSWMQQSKCMTTASSSVGAQSREAEIHPAVAAPPSHVKPWGGNGRSPPAQSWSPTSNHSQGLPLDGRSPPSSGWQARRGGHDRFFAKRKVNDWLNGGAQASVENAKELVSALPRPARPTSPASILMADAGPGKATASTVVDEAAPAAQLPGLHPWTKRPEMAVATAQMDPAPTMDFWYEELLNGPPVDLLAIKPQQCQPPPDAPPSIDALPTGIPTLPVPEVASQETRHPDNAPPLSPTPNPPLNEHLFPADVYDLFFNPITARERENKEEPANEKFGQKRSVAEAWSDGNSRSETKCHVTPKASSASNVPMPSCALKRKRLL
eukprot:GGOE01043646.1.p1 GENE.GGOE01043646.1~~GGOE01043646.1.p1  ORF type:complete len:384 (-),score=66.61 GGOE01043646.1:216-1340(-)